MGRPQTARRVAPDRVRAGRPAERPAPAEHPPQQLLPDGRPGDVAGEGDPGRRRPKPDGVLEHLHHRLPSARPRSPDPGGSHRRPVSIVTHSPRPASRVSATVSSGPGGAGGAGIDRGCGSLTRLPSAPRGRSPPWRGRARFPDRGRCCRGRREGASDPAGLDRFEGGDLRPSHDRGSSHEVVDRPGQRCRLGHRRHCVGRVERALPDEELADQSARSPAPGGPSVERVGTDQAGHFAELPVPLQDVERGLAQRRPVGAGHGPRTTRSTSPACRL